MGRRYTTEERIFGGSMEPRLNPKIADTALNAKIGGRFPSPMVRQTNTSCVQENGAEARKSRIGIPDRFKRY
jgi:hypothetical protein